MRNRGSSLSEVGEGDFSRRGAVAQRGDEKAKTGTGITMKGVKKG
jgi:hypothetical protein